MTNPMTYAASESANFGPLFIVALLSVLHLLQASFARGALTTALSSIFGLGLALLSMTQTLFVPTSFAQLLSASDFQQRFTAFFLSASVVVAFFLWDYIKKSSEHAEELFCLFQISVLGGLVLIGANHLATVFLGLELMSIPVYGMLYYFRKKQGCLEAGLKYILLASFSTAFLMFGFAILYSQSGNLSLASLARVVAESSNASAPAAQIAFLLIFVGVIFKLGLAPLHMWMPEVYAGAPLPVVAHLATLGKLGVLVFAARFFWMCGVVDHPFLSGVFLAVCVLSMLAGSFLVVFEKSPKRILAYSSMVHMSYLLLPVLQGPSGADILSFYAFVYLVAVLCSFGALTMFSQVSREIEHVKDLSGLWRTRPQLTLVFALSLLSLIGLPLTAGFIGKFQVLSLLAGSSQWLLMALVVFTSLVSLYAYVAMLSQAWGNEGDAIVLQVLPVNRGTAAVSCALAIFLVAVGVYPQPLLTMLQGLSLHP